MASDIGDRLRAVVARRAAFRCEYCLIAEDDAGFPHQVDHVLSRKHGGATHPDNLAFACVLCNRNKGSDVAAIDAQTGRAVLLFNPRQSRWADHFRLAGPVIEPLTIEGAVTARLLRFNAAERVTERRLLQRLGRYPPSTR